MSEQNEKLTAEAKNFIFELLDMKLDAEYGNVTGKDLVLKELIDWHAQQVEHATAELRKEMEVYKERAKNNQVLFEAADELKMEAQRQRDEAVKALKDETQELHDLLMNAPVDFLGTGDTHSAAQEEGEFREAINLVMMRVEATIYRLSSGETKLEPTKPTWECYEYHRANMPAYGCTQQCAECAEEQSKKSKSQ